MGLFRQAQIQIDTSSFVDRAYNWSSNSIQYMADIWDRGALGLKYGEILTITAIMLFALFVRGVFARTVVRAIKNHLRVMANGSDPGAGVCAR